MPDTGWKKEWPKVDGFYWWRRSEIGVPERITGPCRVASGSVYIIGHANPRRVPSDREWLGPVTPSDFEQLVRLREVAEKALTYIDSMAERLGYPQNKDAQNVAHALRAALETKP